MLPRCYIVEDHGHLNFRPAERFGQLVVCIDPEIQGDLQRKAGVLSAAMRDVSSADYLIPCGSPSLIALAGAYMASRTGTIRTLVWSKGRYIPFEIAAAWGQRLPGDAGPPLGPASPDNLWAGWPPR